MSEKNLVSLNDSGLQKEVIDAIECILIERKLKWMSNTEEFTSGLLVGLEIAGLFGDRINEVYTASTTDTND